jgi:hypothetical protein
VPSDRYLVWSPRCDEAHVACTLSGLEAATAVARTLSRTLVLPRVLTRDGTLDAVLELSRLHSLVRVVPREQLDAARARSGMQAGEDVALCRVSVASASHPWLDVPTERVSSEELAALVGERPELTTEVMLSAPLRGRAAVRQMWGKHPHAVLVVDGCAVGAVSPSSLLDAGEREIFARALRPSPRKLHSRLLAFIAQLPRPCIAVRAPSIVHADDVVHAVTHTTRVTPKAWLLATSDDTAPLPAALTAAKLALPRVDTELLVRDESDTFTRELLHMSLCALADYYVGAARSLDSEWIRRFRVNGLARFVEHVRLLPLGPVLRMRSSHWLGQAAPQRCSIASRCLCRCSSHLWQRQLPTKARGMRKRAHQA